MVRYSKPKEQPFRPCDYPGCKECGSYKAPKDRRLQDYYWFCLEHVKEYNKNWDFYKGLSPEEIEQHLRHDETWQRPTWKLGAKETVRGDRIHDKYEFFHPDQLGMSGKYVPPPAPKVHKKLQEALDFMEITLPCAVADVKKKYKKLAKQYHPDVNGGDKEASRRFLKLQKAYEEIITYLGGK